MNKAAASPAGGNRSAGARWVVAATLAVGLVMLLAVASVPLAPRDQALFAGGALVASLAISRFAGRRASLLLITMSLVVCSRYVVWRLADTLQFSTWTELAFGLGLLLAEGCAVLLLVTGAVRCLWPLDRAPRALPADSRLWPTVDVLVVAGDAPMPAGARPAS